MMLLQPAWLWHSSLQGLCPKSAGAAGARRCLSPGFSERQGARGASRPNSPEAREAQVAPCIAESLIFQSLCSVVGREQIFCVV